MWKQRKQIRTFAESRARPSAVTRRALAQPIDVLPALAPQSDRCHATGVDGERMQRPPVALAPIENDFTLALGAFGLDECDNHRH